MIIFHEGLPGAGKSYEAMVERIIPAIAKGRTVVAYVEGLNHDHIAGLAQVTPERCRELLRVITREELQEVDEAGKVVADKLPSLAVDNAMIVLDEAQNFWGNRARIGRELTEFITEHRHRGIDIVLMGQDMRDVHATWRRRVELKLSFLKLNGLGAGKRYSVTTFRHLGGDQFTKLSTVVRKYDPKYFGSYASHVSDDTNTEVYQDKRATLWHTPAFKYGAPLVLCLAVWGAWRSWTFFHPEPVKPVASAAARPAAPASAVAGQAAAAPQAPAKPDRQPEEVVGPESVLRDLSERHRIRLAGLMMRGDKVQGVVEWVDSGARVVERLTLETLRDMGVALLIGNGFVRLQAGTWQAMATMWPTEAEGRVSAERQRLVAGEQAPAAPGGPSIVAIGPDTAAPASERSEPAQATPAIRRALAPR